MTRDYIRQHDLSITQHISYSYADSADYESQNSYFKLIANIVDYENQAATPSLLRRQCLRPNSNKVIKKLRKFQYKLLL